MRPIIGTAMCWILVTEDVVPIDRDGVVQCVHPDRHPGHLRCSVGICVPQLAPSVLKLVMEEAS